MAAAARNAAWSGPTTREPLGGKNDGLGSVNYYPQLRDIVDGTSNTFLFLEKANYMGQSWLFKNTGSNHFIFVHHPAQGYAIAWLAGSGVPTPPNTTYWNTRGCGQLASGGINVSMCDGSMRFVKNSVNFNIYTATLHASQGGNYLERRLLNRNWKYGHGLEFPGGADGWGESWIPPAGREPLGESFAWMPG